MSFCIRNFNTDSQGSSFWILAPNNSAAIYKTLDRTQTSDQFAKLYVVTSSGKCANLNWNVDSDEILQINDSLSCSTNNYYFCEMGNQCIILFTEIQQKM